MKKQKITRITEFADNVDNVIIYGSSLDGFYLTQIELSIPYLDGVFNALHLKCLQESETMMPQVIKDWANMSGWWESSNRFPIEQDEVMQLIELLAILTIKDFPQESGKSQDLLRCTRAIDAFLRERLERGEKVDIG